MSTTYKIIRFLGLLGAAGIVLNLVISTVVSAQGGSGLTAGYIFTVTIPYGLWAVCLALPYSKIRGGMWMGAFTLLCLSGAYVCLYMATHLRPQDWLMILPFVLLFLSQPAVIWLSRHEVPNQTLEATADPLSS